MLPPKRYAEKGLHKSVWRALNDFRDYLISITPTGGKNVKIQRTSRGVLIEAEPQSVGGDTRDDMIFVGDWTADIEIPYNPQDTFIKDNKAYVTLELDPKAGETAKQDPATSTRYRQLPSGGAANIKQVQIKEVKEDVLIVRELRWSTSGYYTVDPDFMVAKPWYLRMLSNVTESYNGLPVNTRTYNSQSERTLTLGSPYTGCLVHQGLQPRAYTVDDWLFVAQSFKQNVIEPTQPAEGVLWEDLNIDARHWETDYQLVSVCILGVRKEMLIQGSDPF